MNASADHRAARLHGMRASRSSLVVLLAGVALIAASASAAASPGDPVWPRYDIEPAAAAADDAAGADDEEREKDPRGEVVPYDSVDVGDGWTTDFGGEVRWRWMTEINKSLMDTTPRHNDYHLFRTRLHADLRHESGFRFYVETVDARIAGEERPATPIDRNDLDLLNAYVEYDFGTPTVRLGRMEMQEGAQRLISPLDWGNTRRTFDGAMVRLDHEGGGRTDIFAVQPVMVNVHDGDRRDKSRWFAGIYHTAKTETGAWDLFALSLTEHDDILLGDDLTMGDMALYTFGGRLAGKCDDTDYELWGAKQYGDRAGDTIRAYAWSARVGQTFPGVPGKPRIGLDVDYASGDSTPGDGKLETFNQHYPLGHAYFGYLDLVGRQNIIDVQPSATVKVAERTTVRGAFHAFRLAQAKDALYNAGGKATFADPTGAASRDVGTEVDLTLLHIPECLGGKSKVLLGWSRFFAGEHIDDLGGKGDAELFYVQYSVSF